MNNKWSYPLHYEDEYYVILEKPAWTLVHASKEAPAAQDMLQTIRRFNGEFLFPLHRLDRQSSGCLVFAKTAEAAAKLQAIWHGPEVTKTYTCYVYGCPEQKFVSQRELTNKRTKTKQTAETHFKTLEYYDKGALLKACIKTGRRHQIRRHLSSLGHHIVGDRMYGKGRINKWAQELGLERLFLHATQLELVHPYSHRSIVVHSPLPNELQSFLDKLSGKRDQNTEGCPLIV